MGMYRVRIVLVNYNDKDDKMSVGTTVTADSVEEAMEHIVTPIVSDIRK